MICETLSNQVKQTLVPQFVGDLPSHVTEGISFSSRLGDEINHFFGSKEFILKPVVICNIRTKQYPTGEVLANKVSEALDGYKDELILQCYQARPLDYLGQSLDKLHEFQLEFQLIILDKGEV